MKKLLFLATLLALVSFSIAAQGRVDLGITVPKSGGFISGSQAQVNNDITTALADLWIPFPEISFYYQADFNPIKLGIGVRAYSFILQTVMWPNAFAELELGPFFVQAQLGGLAFATFGLVSNANFGAVLIPDLSAWIAFDEAKSFRVGGGAMGLMTPDITGSDMLFILYFGVKASLPL